MANVEGEAVKIVKPDNTPYKVLIVDDSPFIVKQLTRILSSAGLDIAGTAENGQDAIRRYEELQPNVDLVTMDITMPKMDGITAVGEIKKVDPNAKIIMVTALGHEKMVRKAVLKGAKSFIVKPFKRDKVLGIVKSVLAKA
jgi:two-component system chemotaxis response regulator CheY